MTQNTQTPAGWYPDPLGLPQLRWWDGRSWTEHTSDARLPLVAQDDDQVPLVETAPAAEPADEPVIIPSVRAEPRRAQPPQAEPPAVAAPAPSENATPTPAPGSAGSSGSEAFMQAAFEGREGDTQSTFREEASKPGWNLEEQFDQVFQEEVDRAAPNLDAQFDAAFGGGSPAAGLEAQFDAAFGGSAAGATAASASPTTASASASPSAPTRLDTGFDRLLGGGASSGTAPSPAGASATAFTAPGAEPDLNHFDAMFGSEPEFGSRQAPSFPAVPPVATPSGMPPAAPDFSRIPAPIPVDSPEIDHDEAGRSRSPRGESLRKLFRRDS